MSMYIFCKNLSNVLQFFINIFLYSNFLNMNSFFNPRTFTNQKLPKSIEEFADMLTDKICYLAKLRISSKDIKGSEEYQVYMDYYKELLKWIDYIMVITPFSGFRYAKKNIIKERLKTAVGYITKMPYAQLSIFM